MEGGVKEREEKVRKTGWIERKKEVKERKREREIVIYCVKDDIVWCEV